jgi:hypothetical protein
VNTTVTRLSFYGINFWHDVDAADVVLSALRGHPSLRMLNLNNNSVGTSVARRTRAGALLGALVAANAPALQELLVLSSSLRDEGLGPLVDALAGNTHLRTLRLGDNAMSDAFALHRLLPALLANTSLRLLQLLIGTTQPPGLHALERLVAQRAAARAAAASGSVP